MIRQYAQPKGAACCGLAGPRVGQGDDGAIGAAARAAHNEPPRPSLSSLPLYFMSSRLTTKAPARCACAPYRVMPYWNMPAVVAVHAVFAPTPGRPGRPGPGSAPPRATPSLHPPSLSFPSSKPRRQSRVASPPRNMRSPDRDAPRCPPPPRLKSDDRVPVMQCPFLVPINRRAAALLDRRPAPHQRAS